VITDDPFRSLLAHKLKDIQTVITMFFPAPVSDIDFPFSEDSQNAINLAPFAFILLCPSNTFLISLAIAAITGTVTELPNCL